MSFYVQTEGNLADHFLFSMIFKKKWVNGVLAVIVILDYFHLKKLNSLESVIRLQTNSRKTFKNDSTVKNSGHIH